MNGNDVPMPDRDTGSSLCLTARLPAGSDDVLEASATRLVNNLHVSTAQQLRAASRTARLIVRPPWLPPKMSTVLRPDRGPARP